MSSVAIIRVRKHGQKKWQDISSEEIPFHEQNQRWKEICRVTIHPEFAEAAFWDSSGGVTRRRKLVSPAEAKAKEKKKAATKPEAKKKAPDEAEGKKKAQDEAEKAGQKPKPPFPQQQQQTPEEPPK